MRRSILPVVILTVALSGCAPADSVNESGTDKLATSVREEGTLDCQASYPDPTVQAECVAGVIARTSNLPPCVEEDDNGPCMWDAWAVGNGIGHSFIAWGDGSWTDIVTGVRSSN